MNRIHILDCTLRDGGYCNDWRFGEDNARRIVEGLVNANVEIIECGFISNKTGYDENSTMFQSITDIARILPADKDEKMFVAMINYGEYDVNELPNYDGTSVDGIRVAFHKKDLKEALEACRKIKEKGYLVFVQAMVSLSYSDEEFLSLISLVNELEPYAFYIVDSFGMMKEKDLIRLFYVVEHNLNGKILIGFHCHNNMQLAYSNSQKLITLQTNRNLIIDSSIMGMGRGAGNLNTELFLEYLNENAEDKYNIKQILAIMDKILTQFYERNYWGYSLPNYISARHNAHPNYAAYLDAKKTLTFENMNEIFDMMDEDKKVSYDKDYIEDLYIKYQEKDRIQEVHLSDLKERINGKAVLIIAPGNSSVTEKNKIVSCAKQKNTITISINYEFDDELTDFVFVSNLRRYRDIPSVKKNKCIVTSNISALDVYVQVRYKDLLNQIETVEDNAGLMLLKLLMTLGARKVFIAGMDGYSINSEANYADQRMDFRTEKGLAVKKNVGITSVLKEYRKHIDIDFITTPKYIVL